MLKIFSICSVVFYSVHLSAAMPEQEDTLLNTLIQPQPEYVMHDEDYYIDPKILKSSHVVGWVVAPQVDISRQEYRGYKRPVEVAMTIIAATGKIAESKMIRSSGAKKVDQKVLQALSQALLERIPYADANATYVLTQKFDIEKPL